MPISRPTDIVPVMHFDFVGFNCVIGHRLISWRPGFIEMALDLRPDLINASGVAHGGVLMSLLDSACGIAASYEGPDHPRRLCRTLSFTTQFLSPARDGMLSILGQKRGGGRNIFVCESEICDQQGTTIATGTGTFRYVRPEDSAAKPVEIPAVAAGPDR